jgi:hypothetical protein
MANLPAPGLTGVSLGSANNVLHGAESRPRPEWRVLKTGAARCPSRLTATSGGIMSA